MSIDGINDFVDAYKRINESHVQMYSNNVSYPDKWSESDFEVSSNILKSLDVTSRITTVSAVKKAYDLVKGYHRSYRVHNLTKDDYYQAAIHDRQKDSIIIDRIATSINTIYDKHLSIEKAELVDGK